jgi:hypothetical protein
MKSAAATRNSCILAVDLVVDRTSLEFRSGLIGCPFIERVNEVHHGGALDDN